MFRHDVGVSPKKTADKTDNSAKNSTTSKSTEEGADKEAEDIFDKAGTEDNIEEESVQSQFNDEADSSFLVSSQPSQLSQQVNFVQQEGLSTQTPLQINWEADKEVSFLRIF